VDFQISVKHAKQFPCFLCNLPYVTTDFSEKTEKKKDTGKIARILFVKIADF
jgi:hypothetical protein